MGMASCTWPPAAVWRAVFKQYYSSSSFSKWHQLYVDSSCVLLGLKTALLVDYITPDAKKLQLYFKDVAKTVHDRNSKESAATDHESQFCRCMSDCCILTIGEDTLLINMRRLTRDWGIDHDHDGSKLRGCSLKPAQSVDSHAPLRDGPVYLDITKGLQGPKIVKDETSATLDLNGVFTQWLGSVKLSFQQLNTDKTELCIIPCHTKIPNSSIQSLNSVQLPVDEDETSNSGSGMRICGNDVELNVCTLFGQLLGYPVIYSFDSERGYSLDMVELVCFTVCIRKSDSGTSPLDIEQVAT